MQNTPNGRVDLENGRQVLEAMRERIANGGWNGKATLRATAHLVKNARLEGRIGRFHFEADEPPERGGEDTAPSPLEYFLIGAAF
jgi:hypothetical protein